MFIDTHTHLFSASFNEDRTEIVQKAIDAGVELCLLPNIDVASIQPMKELVSEFPDNCIPMMGLHPGSIDENWKENLEIIRKDLFENKYIAVGEIGMDLYWDKTFVSAQREAFSMQVQWAKELNLPIVIHAREAFTEIYEVLDELNDDSLRGVFHCFTGSKEDVEKILSYGGFKLGIGGVITFKNSKLDEVIKDVDLEHLILETDSPYLPPVPFRGKRNESSYLLHVAEKLADVKVLKLKDVEKVTTSNAKELFSL
ncbi:MAG: TatD family hydrolase [Flavobacteriales bacterium]|nr:TatD family hydrolase [Flavobacteriales bacterium]